MSGAKEWLMDRLEDIVWAKERMDGDEFTQKHIALMAPVLAKEVQNVDPKDAPTYKGRQLLSLGMPPGKAEAGNVMCERLVYIDSNGKFYVEGPRNSFGKTIVDIHPYGLHDAEGWSGISARQITDLMTTYFI